MDGIIAYILSKKYINDTVIGMGAIKGAACQVQSINKANKTTTITLKWEDNTGVSHTQSFDIEDGEDGVSVTNATIKPNGHLELTLSDGNIIDCGKVLPQYDTMPVPSSSNEGQILQYIGTTTSNYTNGYFYQCINDGGVYKWVEKSVQDSYTKIEIGALSDLPDNTKNVVENIVNINSKLDDKENIFRYNVIPLASASISGAIIQYIGTTNDTYTNGYYYQCVESPIGSGTYTWVQKNVQPNNGGTGGDGVVDGYYNSADQLFYEDSAFLNPITGESDTIYVDLNTNALYRYNGTIFIKVSSSSESIQVTTLPSADSSQVNKIYQYIGTTDINCTNGYFYKCVFDGSTYKWVNIATQDSYTKAEIGQLSDLPDTSKTVIENIDLLNGSVVNIKTDISTLQGSVLNIKTDISDIQGSLATIDKDKLDKLAPVYLIGSGLSLDTTVGSPTYGKLQATGMSIPIDDVLSETSINPVQNKVITLELDKLQGSVLEKIQKKLSAQEDNFAVFTDNGDIKDSGISKNVVPNTVSISNKLLVASDLSAKVDKVSGAINDDIALLDSTGNLKDSTKKLSDYQEKLTKGDGIDIDTNNKISVDISYLTASKLGYIPNTEKGISGGIATLDNTGKVPSGQLPSYVDDVIEGYLYNGDFYKDAGHTDIITPEDSKIYVNLTDNTTYRWGGTAYVQISSSLALGTTSTTAYYGDKGETAYQHSQIKDGSNPHNTTADNINLKVPIPALSGSKLDVESTLYGINTELGKKADKVTSAVSGDLAGLDSNGNVTDSGIDASKVIQKVTTATGLLKDDGTVDTTEYQPKTLAVPIQTLSGSQLTVETALDGINNDVVKTFTGTQAQWDALSLTNKQKYGICNITDDGSTDNVYTVGEVDTLLNNKMSYADNGVLGSKNLLPPIGSTTTVSGITWTVNNDGIVTANGTSTSPNVQLGYNTDNFIAPFTGIVFLTGGITNNEHLYAWDIERNARPYLDASKTALQTNNQYDNNGHYQFYIEKGKGYRVVARIATSGTTVTNLVFKPMLRIASDPDDTYVPYAMTNRELTEKIYGEISLTGTTLLNIKSVDETITLSESYKNFNKLAFACGRNNEASGVQIFIFPVNVLTSMFGTGTGHLLLPIYDTKDSSDLAFQPVTICLTSDTLITVTASSNTTYGIRKVWGII